MDNPVSAAMNDWIQKLGGCDDLTKVFEVWTRSNAYILSVTKRIEAGCLQIWSKRLSGSEPKKNAEDADINSLETTKLNKKYDEINPIPS